MFPVKQSQVLDGLRSASSGRLDSAKPGSRGWRGGKHRHSPRSARGSQAALALSSRAGSGPDLVAVGATQTDGFAYADGCGPESFHFTSIEARAVIADLDAGTIAPD